MGRITSTLCALVLSALPFSLPNSADAFIADIVGGCSIIVSTSNGSYTESCPEPELHIYVKPKEGLWHVAERGCGDSSKWIDIADLNDIKTPYIIQPYQELTLPYSCKNGLR